LGGTERRPLILWLTSHGAGSPKKGSKSLAILVFALPKKEFLLYNRIALNQASCLFQWPSRVSSRQLGLSAPGRPFKFNKIKQQYYAKILFIRPQINRY
jgi:hypothetical protein